MYSTSGFTSENSLSGRPRTPPDSPSRVFKTGKRSRIERSNSPASLTGSLHVPETISPASIRPAKKRFATDNIKVEELTEDDAGYIGDIDIVYPEDTESGDESDKGHDSNQDTATDTSDGEVEGITQRLSRTGCTDHRAHLLEVRNERRRRRRETNQQHSKRSHSQSTKNEPEPTDSDALGDHDLVSSARRQRRRIDLAEMDRPYLSPDYVYFTCSETGSPAPTGIPPTGKTQDSTVAMDVDAGQ